MHRPTHGPFHAPLGAATLLLTTAAVLLVPSAAQAEEGDVQSRYSVDCSTFGERSSDESTDPAGVAFDGERSDATSSPAERRISGGSLAADPGDTGEYCTSSARFADVLTVGPGGSGLEPGAVVPVTVTVRLAGALDENWDPAVPEGWSANARYSGEATVRALDGCDESGEVPVCDTPLFFQGEHRHDLDAGTASGSDADGYVEAWAYREAALSTNVGAQPVHGLSYDESRPGESAGRLCEAWPCSPEDAQMHPNGVEPIQLTGSAQLVVGARYAVVANLDWVAETWGNTGVTTSVTVDDFTLSIRPDAGYQEVELAYASAGEGPRDTVAPTLAPLADLTAVAGPDGTAPVSWTATATDDVDPAPAVSCTPPSGSAFPVGATQVTCTATDAAGNSVTGAFTVTVTAATSDPMDRLREAIEGADLSRGVRTALLVVHRTADRQFDAGRTRAGCGLLRAMDLGIVLQRRWIPSDEAAMLRGLVREAQGAQGC